VACKRGQEIGTAQKRLYHAWAFGRQPSHIYNPWEQSKTQRKQPKKDTPGKLVDLNGSARGKKKIAYQAPKGYKDRREKKKTLARTFGRTEWQAEPKLRRTHDKKRTRNRPATFPPEVSAWCDNGKGRHGGGARHRCFGWKPRAGPRIGKKRESRANKQIKVHPLFFTESGGLQRKGDEGKGERPRGRPLARVGVSIKKIRKTGEGLSAIEGSGGVFRRRGRVINVLRKPKKFTGEVGERNDENCKGDEVLLRETRLRNGGKGTPIKPKGEGRRV